MDTYAIVIAVLMVGWTCFLWLRSGLRRAKLPPGPRPFPIIGNILQLGNKPHQTFAKLAKTYGPLMSIHLGSVYTVVVSSPEMAREIMLKRGQAFSSRHKAQALRACDHDKFSVAFLPLANSKWRDLRKISKEQMFAHHSLEASQGLRDQKLEQLLEYVNKCCDSGRVVDIGEAAFITTLNLMSATLFSLQATKFESQVTKEFKDIMMGVSTIVGVPNFADYFPILKPFDPQGVMRRAEYYFGKLLAIIDTYLVERLESRKRFPDAPKKTDLLETLIDISQGKEYAITNDDIKHLLLDLFVGGSETSSTSIEWIMSKLILNPDKLAKLKHELHTVVGEKNQVQESDMPRLPYLQAVIKEVLRFHPPGPLLLPRAATTDQEINGYVIPKGAQILINAWAIGRDPSIWQNPDSFEPERFLGQKTDFKGQDFELIPFGAGRRVCPGMPLANRIMHQITANLVHNFDWKLDPTAVVEDQNAELFGLVARRAVPLRLIPIKA